MEKRVLGLILSVLGIGGLIFAGISFIVDSSGTKDIKTIIIAGILGVLFFFAGIGLVKNTQDKPT